MTHSSSYNVNGGIHLKILSCENVDITKYSDFGSHKKFWFKDNYSLSPSEPGRWLGISCQTLRLICYRILTQAGIVISISTVLQVNIIDLSSDEFKKTIVKFNAEIHRRLKCTNLVIFTRIHIVVANNFLLF